jgi:gentisate 1,2-dioxygenase
MACFAQLIRPGEHLKAHRHTGSAVYYVAQGSGVSIIDGRAFNWSKGDVIALPPWALHEHANASASEDAVLFSMHDTPVFTATGLYHEESLAEDGGHQIANSTFDA